MNTSSALEIRDLNAFYGDTQVLFDVSIDVQEGGVTALLGANGAGKTTTLRAVSGAVKRKGSVFFQGRATTSLTPDAIAKLGIAHVPSNSGTRPDKRGGGKECDSMCRSRWSP